MNTLRLILAALTVFRLSLMISSEAGPAWIFCKLRRLPSPKSSAREGISCPLCVSVWMAAPVALWLYCFESLPPLAQECGDLFMLWMSLSAVAICVHMTFTKGI